MAHTKFLILILCFVFLKISLRMNFVSVWSIHTRWIIQNLETKTGWSYWEGFKVPRKILQLQQETKTSQGGNNKFAAKVIWSLWKVQHRSREAKPHIKCSWSNTFKAFKEKLGQSEWLWRIHSQICIDVAFLFSKSI